MKKLIIVLGFLFMAIIGYGQINTVRYDVSKVDTFRANVQICIVKSSMKVAGEDTLTWPPAVVAKRNSLAAKVLANPTGYMSRFVLFSCASEYFKLNYNDSIIQMTVDSSWNDVAGVDWEDFE